MKHLLTLALVGLFSLSAFAEGNLRADATEGNGRRLNANYADASVASKIQLCGNPLYTWTGHCEEAHGNDALYYTRNVITWGGLAVAAFTGWDGSMKFSAFGKDDRVVGNWIAGGVTVVNTIWDVVRTYMVNDGSM